MKSFLLLSLIMMLFFPAALPLAFVINDGGEEKYRRGPPWETDDSRVLHYKMVLIGKAIRPKKQNQKDQFPFKFKYYFLISQKGKEFAFPLEFSDVALENKVKKTLGETILIEANLIREHIIVENKVIEIRILNPFKAVLLKDHENQEKLASLGLTPAEIRKVQKMESHILSAHYFDERRPQWSFPLSDDTAEGFLMVAGAMLLAGIISGQTSLTGPAGIWMLPKSGP